MLGLNPGMVIFTHRRIEECGVGAFYLGHKFDETPPELCTSLHCIGKLGEYELDYDIIGYTGNNLDIHILRLRNDANNGGHLDGTISAVLTTNPEYSTPHGLHCGDMPRRARELYGNGGGLFPALRYDCPNSGPITAIGFRYFREPTVDMDAPYYTHSIPDEWFETPAFWKP